MNGNDEPLKLCCTDASRLSPVLPQVSSRTDAREMEPTMDAYMDDFMRGEA